MATRLTVRQTGRAEPPSPVVASVASGSFAEVRSVVFLLIVAVLIVGKEREEVRTPLQGARTSSAVSGSRAVSP
ncbi:hypothetical protein GCM10027079_06130 [Sediminivirga luteola]|uniref:Uncharacterized protein n=1 Tax=Sediminivirga luteola TaxID=1774748 RepID=A0A8J2XKE8_9MICO|nr:hypothetical protein GCM10011333_15110 [Sediminivirga luteola]